MKISEGAREELIWWIGHIDNAVNTFRRGKPSIVIESDASGLGWGVTDGVTPVGGRWSLSERQLLLSHGINHLELLAAYLSRTALFLSEIEEHSHQNDDR